MQILIVNNPHAKESLVGTAMEALQKGHTVCFLCLDNDITPFSGMFDFYANQAKNAWSEAIDDLAQTHNFAQTHIDRYTEWRFKTPLEMVQKIVEYENNGWTVVREDADFKKAA